MRVRQWREFSSLPSFFKTSMAVAHGLTRRLLVKKNHSIIEIAGELRHETEKAYLLFDGSKEVWLAKALCDWDADSKTMQMAEWLAFERGLI